MTSLRREILSLFPGIDLLGRTFEEAGYCVVRGPDVLWGGDIRRFEPRAGHYWGVIGGPPCQDFSSLRRTEATGYGLEMLAEFQRCVVTAEPEWWLMENVARVPDLVIHGWHWQRLDVDQGWFCDVTRLRHFQFGSRSGVTLHIDKPDRVTLRGVTREGAALANDSRSFRELCRLQGLLDDFELPGFTREEAKRAVGNGVPLQLGRVIARAVTEAYVTDRVVTLQRTLDGGAEPAWRCACGCGRRLTGKHRYYDFACRKRAQRRRDATQSRDPRDGSSHAPNFSSSSAFQK
jgi:DNA (cytosine-5)-methyltransferase 1